MRRQRRVHGAVAGLVAVSALLLSTACEPLDGRSATVEIDAGAVLASSDEAQQVPAGLAPAPVPTTVAPAPAPVPPTAPPPPPPAARAVPPWTAALSPAALSPAAPPPPVLSPDRARALAALSSPAGRQVAARALALVRFDWPGRLPGWQLRFRDGRSGVRGLTFPDRQVIEVYVRARDTPASLAHVVAHELGHAVDVTYFTQVQRSAWLAARGLAPRTVWFPGAPGASDFATGAGDFAESFAWVHAPVGAWKGELAPPPNPVQGALLGVLTGGI